MRIKFYKLFLIVTVVCFFNSCSSDTDSPKIESPPISLQIPSFNYTYTSSEDETLALVNSYRVSIGLNALEKNNYISLQSEVHDNYMITNNVVSHDNFDVRYKNITSTLGAIKVGENIAYNFNTPQAAMEAWLKSPSHKECIEGDYTHFGISIRVNAQGKKYYTNIFAKIETRAY